MNKILKDLLGLQVSTKSFISIYGTAVHKYLREEDISKAQSLVLCSNEGQVEDYIRNNIDDKCAVIQKANLDIGNFTRIVTQNIIFDIYRTNHCDKNMLQKIIRTSYRAHLFTIDAIYVVIDEEINGETVPIIDPFKGITDFKKKRLVFMDNHYNIMKEEPIKILNAITLACKYNFSLPPTFMKKAREVIHNVRYISNYNIRNFLEEILLSNKPSIGIELLGKAGVLDILIPELSATYRLKQNSEHHTYDVFTHSILTCDSVIPDLTLRLAALLHDIGKPDTVDLKKKTFYQHEYAGSKTAGRLLTRLGFKIGRAHV